MLGASLDSDSADATARPVLLQLPDRLLCGFEAGLSIAYRSLLGYDMAT
jgi:hypothetical protein